MTDVVGGIVCTCEHLPGFGIDCAGCVMHGQEAWAQSLVKEVIVGHHTLDGIDDGIDRCSVCDGPVDINEGVVCDDCTGLRRCVDDICHGIGYCMHEPEAWRP